MNPLRLCLLLVLLVACAGCSAAPNGGYRKKPKIARPGGLTNNQTIKEINEFNAHMAGH